ncbi:hypothetical protein ACFC5X_20110 [Streptomyces sp. NPDC055952]|uniref:hypothetical protein n=1 Tax=Streptomyces sp. NPDC055952 TaxID=3345663 RepID=UPI0035DDC77B
MPEVLPPEKSNAVRFGEVYAFWSFRVTKPLSDLHLFATFEQEAGFPVGSYKSSAFEPGPMGVIAAPTALLVHRCPEFIADYVDGGVCEGAVPCGGTRSKVSARRAGARGVIRAELPVSTGRAVQARLMDHEAHVLPAEGGVRFGAYTGLMTTRMASALVAPTAPLGAVGR